MGIHAERGLGLGFIGQHILSILTFLPLLGVRRDLLRPPRGLQGGQEPPLAHARASWRVNLVLATWLYVHFDTGFTKVDGNDGYQFIEHGVWIRSLNVEYFVGVDGISVTMVFLTALISFVGVLASWSASTSSSRATSPCTACS